MATCRMTGGPISNVHGDCGRMVIPPHLEKQTVNYMEAVHMETISVNNLLPATGFVRIWNIIGDSKSSPPTPAIIPVSRSTWWAGVKSGRFPSPIKLGPRITAWRVEDIRKLISDSNVSKHGFGGNYDGMGKNRM
jgi:prophage regulatory protein